MFWFIANADIDWSWSRWVSKGPGGFLPRPKERKGFIPMWDRNSQRFAWFKIIKQAANRFGYIVERRSVPSYWKNSIKEEKLYNQEKGKK